MKTAETIKPPINSKRMSIKDRIKLTNNLNNGNIKVFLEVKDENRKLLGFQEIMTIDAYYKEGNELLKELSFLNDEMRYAEGSERRIILKKIEKVHSIISELKKIKIFMLKDEFSYTEELEELGSYKEDEITTSNGKYLGLNKNN